MEPLVSILLPCYNHASFVEAAVRSVMAQEGIAFELLVVDDGSPDQSPAVLDALQKELGFSLTIRENRGLVNSLNELAQQSRGKYICTLASDDVMPSGRLAKQVQFMEQHPNVAASFGQIQVMDIHGNVSSQVEPRYLTGIPAVTFEQLFLGIRELHGCTEMIRRDAFFQVGGFPSDFRIEDFPLWLKLSKVFGPLAVLDSVHCYYRVHGSNMHRKLDFIYQEVLRILASHQDHPLYRVACANWKANWFSSWAYQDKWTAIKLIPRVATLSWAFFGRVPKLLIPRVFLRH